MKPGRAGNAPPLVPDPGAAALAAISQATVDAYGVEQASRHTTRALRTGLRYWGAWYALRYGGPLALPVPVDVVRQFIADHLEHDPQRPAPQVTPYQRRSQTTQHQLPVQVDRLLVERGYKAAPGPWRYATVMARLAVLSRVHERYRADPGNPDQGPAFNPLRDPALREQLRLAQRLDARRARPVKHAQPLTAPALGLLLGSCEEDLAGLRDRALLLLGWAGGGRRRSEIAATRIEDLARIRRGYALRLPARRAAPASATRGEALPLLGEVAEALGAWLQALRAQGITRGALFRSIAYDRIGEGIGDNAVRDIVIRRAKLAGAPVGQFTAHSLRAGFVTEAGRQGVPIGETMALTGHRSVQMAMQYYAAGAKAPARKARLPRFSTGRARSTPGRTRPSRWGRQGG